VSKCFHYCYSGVAPALDSEMQIGSCPWLPLPGPYSNPLIDRGAQQEPIHTTTCAPTMTGSFQRAVLFSSSSSLSLIGLCFVHSDKLFALHSSSGRNEVIPKSQCSVVGRHSRPRISDVMERGMLVSQPPLHPLPLHAGFVFWSPASSGRVKAVAIRRCSSADLVPYLPCAVCTASSTG